jgi:hypothetical protein
VGGFARWLLVTLVVATPLVAHAQGTTSDCHVDPMAPLTVSPSNSATNTSLNAPVIVRYGPGYFDPQIGPGDAPSTLFRMVACGNSCASVCDVTGGTEVPGLVQTQGDDLIFVPDSELSPMTLYAGHATGLDGELDFQFCTGTSRDTQPPSAVAIASVSSTPVSVSCLASGYRIGVTVPSATDDGPLGSIEYLLFQTRGYGVDAPMLVDRFRNVRADRITLAFLLPSEASRTPICLQVVTVDGAGHASIPNGERCFDPVGRTTFQGCAVGGRSSALAVAVGICLALCRRRRRNG